MDFTYDSYGELLDSFLRSGYRVVTVRRAATKPIDPPFLVLRHDVEWNAERALALAAIERSLHVRSTLYFRVDTRANDVRAMKWLQDHGFDIGYHYNCLDRTRGDVAQAVELFEHDLTELRHSGIDIVTAAAHGNPRVRKVGYTANFDLVRRDPGLLNRMGLFDLGDYTNRFVQQPKLFQVSDAGISWNHRRLSRQSLASLVLNGSRPHMFMIVHSDYWSDSWFRPVALHLAAFGMRTLRGNAAIAMGRRTVGTTRTWLGRSRCKT